jgi:hypothetical protein
VDPAAEGRSSDASDRPYRGSAAAAGDGDGRTVVHGRGYKAGSLQGQGKMQKARLDYDPATWGRQQLQKTHCQFKKLQWNFVNLMGFVE